MENTQLEQIVLTTWLDAFADGVRAGGRGERTVMAYVADVRALAAWFEGVNRQPFEPGLLTAWDAREYFKSLAGFKPATINRKLAALKALVAWSKSIGLLSTDPTEELKMVPEQELAPRWLSRADFGKLMRQAERSVNGAATASGKEQALRNRALLCLLAYAGLRVSEVVALQLSDVEITERKGIVRVRSGKGGKARSVPLALEVRKAVEEWIELAGPSKSLWKSKSGDGLTSRQVERMLAELGRPAGVEVTPHRLRHTCAKRMLESGVDLTVVAAVLGHARLDTTARYVKPGWEDLEGAVERI